MNTADRGKPMFPADEPSEIALPEALPELAPVERFRLGQRQAEEATRMVYLPRVLHAGDAKIPPLVRTASGACYAVRVHRRRVMYGEKVVYEESIQHVRVDREPRSKKERRRLRALAKAQAAAAPAEDLCRDGAREARQAHNLEISGCDSQPCNQPSSQADS